MVLISLPPSKSISNRALILASISDNPVILRNLLESDDTKYLMDVLRNLGVKIEKHQTPSPKSQANPNNQSSNYLVTPPNKLQGNDSDTFIGNAGTASRFAVGLSLITEGAFSLRGVDRMHERPFEDLFKAIKDLVDIEYLGKAGFLPVKLSRHTSYTSPHTITISGKVSSQFITALLLVGAKMPGGLKIRIEGDVPSRPYLDMTLEMLRLWGINYSTEQLDNSTTDQVITIKPGVKAPREYTIPPDMSAASIPMAFRAMMRWDLVLDYEKGKTLQGDEAFGDIIQSFENLRTKELENLRTLDFSSCPDVSMTGMVLAAVSRGTTRFKGLESLRVKECDRIEAMREGLDKLGFEVSVEGDEMTIIGDPTIRHTDPAIRINAYHDHRIAFCFAILLYRMGIRDVREIQKIIEHPECVSKTWSEFWLDLASWTGQLRAVSGVVVKKGDRYLLVKKPRKEHAWQLPQGGVDSGENGLKAAKRELGEECGSDLQVKWVGERPVGEYRYFFPGDFDRHDQSITGAHVSFYAAAYIDGEVHVDGEEIVDFLWSKKDQIKNLVSEDYWQAIESFIE